MSEKKKKDNVNWKAWYWVLLIFLFFQIAIYLWITNIYKV